MKQLNAQELFNFLSDLKKSGTDLSKVNVGYRHDYNSDVEIIKVVEEDLFDAKTNNTLESIVLITDSQEL